MCIWTLTNPSFSNGYMSDVDDYVWNDVEEIHEKRNEIKRCLRNHRGNFLWIQRWMLFSLLGIQTDSSGWGQNEHKTLSQFHSKLRTFESVDRRYGGKLQYANVRSFCISNCFYLSFQMWCSSTTSKYFEMLPSGLSVQKESSLFCMESRVSLQLLSLAFAYAKIKVHTQNVHK